MRHASHMSTRKSKVDHGKPRDRQRASQPCALQGTVRCQRRSFRIIGRGTREYIEAEVTEFATHFAAPNWIRDVARRHQAHVRRVHFQAHQCDSNAEC